MCPSMLCTLRGQHHLPLPSAPHVQVNLRNTKPASINMFRWWRFHIPVPGMECRRLSNMGGRVNHHPRAGAALQCGPRDINGGGLLRLSEQPFPSPWPGIEARRLFSFRKGRLAVWRSAHTRPFLDAEQWCFEGVSLDDGKWLGGRILWLVELDRYR